MPRGGDGPSADSSLLGIALRQPPCNIPAEQALLGAVLANNRAFHLVVGFLKPEHFFDPIHGRIYREAARLILRGRVADAVVLKSVFEQSGVLEEVGGTAYLAHLLAAMVGIFNAGEYGRAIHDTWLRRQLIQLGTTMVDNGFGADVDLDGEAQITAASDALLDLTGGAAKEAPEVSAGDAARLAIRNAEAWARGDGVVPLRSGLRPVDDAIGPLLPGWFYILGGRPGMGKTSLATQVAIGVARQLQREEVEAAPFSGAGGDVCRPSSWLAGWSASLRACPTISCRSAA
jgi:replicative DNA helicase